MPDLLHYYISRPHFLRNAAAFFALLAKILLVAPSIARAEPQDYRFELVGEPTLTGRTFTFAVRVARLADESTVTDAMIEAVDYNMTPEGMAGSNEVRPLPVTEPGISTLEAGPEMPGRWELVLRARVLGETEELRGRLIVSVPSP